MGCLNRNRLNPVKKLDDNGVNFDEGVPDCGVCAAGTNRQLADPKTVYHKVQRAFQLIVTDLMGQFTQEAREGFTSTRKISDNSTRWTEIYPLNTKDGTLHAF